MKNRSHSRYLLTEWGRNLEVAVKTNDYDDEYQNGNKCSMLPRNKIAERYTAQFDDLCSLEKIRRIKNITRVEIESV